MKKSEAKEVIKDRFNSNVFGKYPSNEELLANHNGVLGHWFESRLGSRIDSDGNADVYGFECKIDSAKTSWGDWGANYRIFADESYDFKNSITKNMWDFVKYFGVLREDINKGSYYSWSGTHVPTYLNDITKAGTSLSKKDGDILITYNFDDDSRADKYSLVPKNLQKNCLVLLKWYGTDLSFENFKNQVIDYKLPIKVQFNGANRSVSLETRLRRKFNIHGIIVGLSNREKGFYGLRFLKPISLNDWTSFLEKKDVFYDTALTTRNKRPYNQWRSKKKFMLTLEEELYIPKNV